VLARNPHDVGLLIRDQRLKLGLDQRELAERVGVSRQWVVEIEKGKPRAEMGLVLRALTALGLQLDIRTVDVKGPAASASRSKVGTDSRARVNLDDVIARARGKKI